ncbi:MAG: FAD:protein FMN transferase [Desulfococcaceae bacterium]|nr:FAD:protein FMN transferase [Desulfococcaceae bacterium]
MIYPKHIFRKIAILLFSVLLTACGNPQKKEVLIQGRTMGTFYHVKIITSDSTEKTEEKIRKRLEEINRSMSTYDKESEISRFNRIQDTETKFRISQDFMNVMQVAEKLYRLTGGAWDGSIDPLINLWGFGRAGLKQEVPEKDEIQKGLSRTGFHHIEISPEGWLRKKIPEITLDLASIAKGYGVDQVGKVIAETGIRDYLVEIGGEIYASGLRADGKQWRVGINRPKPDAAFDDIYKVLRLRDKGFATSGDYRNFFMKEGIRYSHVLDPRNGYAVSNRVVSASVIADTCTFADGLATALMVLGPEKSLELVRGLENTECLLIREKEDGSLEDFSSPGFYAENY